MVVPPKPSGATSVLSIVTMNSLFYGSIPEGSLGVDVLSKAFMKAVSKKDYILVSLIGLMPDEVTAITFPEDM